MSVVQSEFDQEEFRPGLVLGETRADVPVDTRVRTDVACFLRVRWSPAALDLDAEGVEALFVEELPGSPGGEHLPLELVHHELAEWDETVFRGEFRTQAPALARAYFANGGRVLHLIDLTFSVPAFDPAELPEDEDPELIAEQRLETAFLRMYSWALERLDDFGEGSISQIALPELWTRQVHLLPTIWGMVAGFCRQTGNRFCVGDSCPPFKLLQETERKNAREEGFELTWEELTPAALIPWYREERWGRREDIPVEVALTLDAMHEARRILRDSEVTLSCLGIYWPWLQTGRGLAIPPCGAVAGIFSRSDEENAPVGCMKPPANESVKSVTDVAVHLDERPRNMLQAAGVNLLAARTGKGILVWGARTLAEEDLWRFVNVRRLVGYIGKQLEMDNQWAIFENNDESLRNRLARDVQYFLHDLYELGALRGEAPTEAFRVACDGQNNPPEMVEAGILVVDVWVNPVQTNEFVHLQLKYGDASVQ